MFYYPIFLLYICTYIPWWPSRHSALNAMQSWSHRYTKCPAVSIWTWIYLFSHSSKSGSSIRILVRRPTNYTIDVQILVHLTWLLCSLNCICTKPAAAGGLLTFRKYFASPPPNLLAVKCLKSALPQQYLYSAGGGEALVPYYYTIRCFVLQEPLKVTNQKKGEKHIDTLFN